MKVLVKVILVLIILIDFVQNVQETIEIHDNKNCSMILDILLKKNENLNGNNMTGKTAYVSKGKYTSNDIWWLMLFVLVYCACCCCPWVYICATKNEHNYSGRYYGGGFS